MELITKICHDCKKELEISEFNKHPNCKYGVGHKCRQCEKAYHKNYREKNCKKHRAAAIAWYRANTERAKMTKADNNLHARYKISRKELKRLISVQNGLCAICGMECDTHSRLSVDHCHITGRIRGLLCRRCNSGLGFFKDSVDRLQAAVKYLQGN